MNGEHSKLYEWLRSFAIGIVFTNLILLIIPIMGWIVKSSFIEQLMSIIYPVTVNAVIIMFFGSIAILGVVFKKKWLAIPCSLISMLLSIITQISYFYHHEWNLGEYLNFSTPYFLETMKAHMPLNTAIASVLTGIALICLSFNVLILFSAICGSLATTIGIVGFIGHFFHLLPAYQWTPFGGITIIASLILIGFGLAIVALASIALEKSGDTLRPFHIIVPATVVLYLTTMALYVALLIQKQRDMQELMRLTLSWLEKETVQDFNRFQENLQNIAKIIEISKTSHADDKKYASSYLNNQTGFEALAFISPSLEITWNIWATNKNYFKLLEDTILSQKGYLDKSKTLTTRIFAQDLQQYGFLIFEPVTIDNKLSGWLVGYITDLQIFHDILSDANMAGYKIKIAQNDGTPIYQNNFPSTKSLTSANQVGAELKLEGASWKISIQPNQMMHSHMISYLPEVVLGFGTLFSTLALVLIQVYLRGKQNQKKAHEIEKRLETLIQMSLDAIITGNLEGNIVGWNGGAEQIFGYGRDEAIGKPLAILMPLRYQRAYLKSLQRVLTGDDKYLIGKVFELRGMKKNSIEFPLELSLSLWQNEGISLFTAIVRDITERKNLEDALRESKNKAEEANRLKSEFLKVMSHEMRTPLTSILGYCELLLAPETPTDRYASYAQVIQHSGNHLLSIVGDLLDLTQIETNSLKVERLKCSPRKIGEEIAAIVAPYAEAKQLPFKVEFEGKIPDYIYSDPKRIHQILLKIILNLIELSEKGEIRMIISVPEPKEPPVFLQFRILDTDSGIKKEEMVKLLQAFARGTSSISKKYGGLGLGLLIAKKLAELLGGNLASFIGVGFENNFIITVATGLSDKQDLSKAPLYEPPLVTAKSAEPSTHIDKLLYGKRILLAEDDEDNQRLLVFYLQYSGAIVETAINGREAYEKGLEALRKGQPYDIMILDIEMPEMNGLEAVKKLRSDHYQARIIALTAYGSQEEKDKCIASGFNEVITKPISRDLLIQKLSSYFPKPKVF